MLRYLLWAALGSGAGYYVAKRQLSADYEARLLDEVEATRKYYKTIYEKRLETEMAKTRESAEVLKEAVTELTDAQEEEFRAALEKVMAQTLEDVELVDVVSAHPDIPEQAPEEPMPEEAAEALTNYQGMSAAAEPVGNISRVLEKKTPEEAEEELLTNPIVRKRLTQGVDEKDLTYVKPGGPRLIDFDAYDQNGGDYQQQTVVYYVNDSEVTDENDQKLDKTYVGKHISYANLATLNENNTTIWVRDDKNRLDFEVVFSKGSYDSVVLGKTPKEPGE
jgi:hypothetical protein